MMLVSNEPVCLIYMYSVFSIIIVCRFFTMYAFYKQCCQGQRAIFIDNTANETYRFLAQCVCGYAQCLCGYKGNIIRDNLSNPSNSQIQLVSTV